jgi:two-component system, OmpR family, sensor kinase
MGRLYWKFFFVLWLTLMTTVVVISTVIELAHDGVFRPKVAMLLPDFEPPPDFNHKAHRPTPILPIIVGTLSSFLFSAVLAWYFAKPIRTLQNAFAELADGKLDTRIATAMGGRNDELANLGRDFDHMAIQLGGLITAQQRLLHDVSHELRSPLARMQLAIGLAQQQPDKIPSTLVRIERDSQRISDLVGELLVLSRLEAGVLKADKEEIELAELLADIVDNARFEAERKHVCIQYYGFDSLLVQGYGELLHRAVENVLRNAVQHAKRGGVVTLKVSFDKTTEQLFINVLDDGPGIDEQYLDLIFQAFFRNPQQAKNDSVGLGLTIAHSAITAHGGQIRAHNRPEGGLHVAIEIPFAGQENRV